MNKALWIAAGFAVCVMGTGMAQAQGASQAVADGMKVTFDYTLTVEKQQVETTQGKKPLEYVQGQKMLIPGLEKQLAGMKPGESKTVTIKPEDAYGAVRADAIHEMDKAKLPKDITLKVGMVLEMQDPEGRSYPAVVKEIKDKTFLLDFNHPLAGKELTFDVKIVAVEPAPAAPAAPAATPVPAVKK